MKLEKHLNIQKSKDTSLLEFSDTRVSIKSNNEYTFPLPFIHDETQRDIQFFYDTFVSEAEHLLDGEAIPSHIHYNETSILFSVSDKTAKYTITLSVDEYLTITKTKDYLEIANLLDYFIHNCKHIPNNLTALYEEIKSEIK